MPLKKANKSQVYIHLAFIDRKRLKWYPFVIFIDVIFLRGEKFDIKGLYWGTNKKPSWNN